MGKEFRTLMNTLEVELHESSNIQAVVLCGEGDKAFSAGGNLKWLQSFHNNSIHANVDLMMQFYTSFLCMRQKIPVPDHCSIDRTCYGCRSMLGNGM